MIDLTKQFNKLGFTRLPNSRGIYEKELPTIQPLNIPQKIRCHYRQEPHNPTWLTIELIQDHGNKPNIFLKYNGKIQRKSDLKYLINMIFYTKKLPKYLELWFLLCTLVV